MDLSVSPYICLLPFASYFWGKLIFVRRKKEAFRVWVDGSGVRDAICPEAPMLCKLRLWFFFLKGASLFTFSLNLDLRDTSGVFIIGYSFMLVFLWRFLAYVDIKWFRTCQDKGELLIFTSKVTVSETSNCVCDDNHIAYTTNKVISKHILLTNYGGFRV